MKYIEIILKLAFLVLSIILIITRAVTSPWFCGLLIVSAILGLVLIFNKKTSYGSWGCGRKDYVMRRVEGILLVFAAISGYYLMII